MKRREFLKVSVLTALGAAVAACAQPTPQVIEKQVPVEKIVKETVVVEKQVPVEKTVKETVVVEKEKVVEKVVTATAVPAKYKEAPQLAEQVKAGKLPPLTERLPQTPYVVTPEEGIGKFGGQWTMLIAAAGDTKLSHVYGGSRLVRWDKTLSKMLPDVAEKFEVKDGKEFTFYLRKGMKWSDGNPFTTEDFKFWWEDIANNKELSPNGPTTSVKLATGELPTVSFPDAYTVKYVWPKPNKSFFNLLAGSMGLEIWAPKHWLKQFHTTHGDKAAIEKLIKDEGLKDWMALFGNRNQWYGQNIPNMPTIQPWIPQTKPPAEKYTFIRNPYFHKVDTQGNQLPYLDELVMLQTDAKILALKCTAGDADLQQRSLNFTDITLLKDNEAKGAYEVRLWGSDWATIMRLLPNYDTQDKVMGQLYLDKRFRHALSLAINREEINKVLYLGLAVPQQAEMLPGRPGYNEKWAQSYAKFDVKEANRLLDEVGLTKKDGEGYRLRPDGKTLDLLIEDAGENPVYADMIQLITSTFKQVGIKVLYKFTERATYRARMASGEAAMGLWASELGMDFANGEPGLVYRFDGQSDGMGTWSDWYSSKGQKGVKPPAEYTKMQELSEKWLETFDQAAADKIRDEIRAIQAEELFQIGTVGGAPWPVVVKKTMRGVPKEGYSLWSRGGYFYWMETSQLWKG